MSLRQLLDRLEKAPSSDLAAFHMDKMQVFELRAILRRRSKPKMEYVILYPGDEGWFRAWISNPWNWLIIGLFIWAAII